MGGDHLSTCKTTWIGTISSSLQKTKNRHNRQKSYRSSSSAQSLLFCFPPAHTWLLLYCFLSALFLRGVGEVESVPAVQPRSLLQFLRLSAYQLKFSLINCQIRIKTTTACSGVCIRRPVEVMNRWGFHRLRVGSSSPAMGPPGSRT